MLAEMSRGTTSMLPTIAVQMSFEVALRLVIIMLFSFRFFSSIHPSQTNEQSYQAGEKLL